MINLAIGFSIIIALAAISVLAYLVRKIATQGKDLALTCDWVETLSFDRYRPLLRILDGGDFEFLRSQPGFKPSMAAKLRAQRAHIARAYLNNLETDFGRVCMAVKMIMAQSTSDRPDLAASLIRQQINFASSMLMVRFQLCLYSRGYCSVNVVGLVKMFDVTRVEVRTLVPASSRMAA